MDNETIALLITTLAPFITSALRWLLGTYIPRAALPVIAGAAGSGLALLADMQLGTDLGPAVGAGVGFTLSNVRNVAKILFEEGLRTSAKHDEAKAELLELDVAETAAAVAAKTDARAARRTPAKRKRVT
jgi:hypothetical protein